MKPKSSIKFIGMFASIMIIIVRIPVQLLTKSKAEVFFMYFRHPLISIPMIILGLIAAICALNFAFKMRYTYFPTKLEKQENRALKAIDDMEPLEAIHIYEQILPELPQAQRANARRKALMNNLAVAYLDCGEFEKAIKIWVDSLEIPVKNNMVFDALVHLNLAATYVDMHDITSLDEKLHYIQETYQNGAKLPKDLDDVLLQMQVNRNIISGNYESAEAFYVEKLNTQQDDIKQVVVTKYRLSQIYEKMGDMEKQCICLRFVSENGKDTFWARNARNALLKLSCT